MTICEDELDEVRCRAVDAINDTVNAPVRTVISKTIVRKIFSRTDPVVLIIPFGACQCMT